jgi:hypothetical protein
MRALIGNLVLVAPAVALGWYGGPLGVLLAVLVVPAWVELVERYLP